MPQTPEADSPAARVGEALRRLPLVVSDATCTAGATAVASYPGGSRPTSRVTLRGAGRRGLGENVAWTEEAHEAFAERLARLPRGAARLGDWSAAAREAFADPYERAALEAAAIDLVLRQHETTLFALAGVPPTAPRYVVSFGRLRDPVAETAAEPEAELKLDVDPSWDDDVWARLAARGRVAILDFKAGGTVADHERAHRALPEAIVEDPAPDAGPWSASLAARVSFDAPITSADALATLPIRPAAINVKPARMGGVLEALACAARCTAAGIAVYVGGMFEVNVGRAQLRTLAALLSAEAPNDIAPIPVGDAAPERPRRLPVDAAALGFGGTRA